MTGKHIDTKYIKEALEEIKTMEKERKGENELERYWDTTRMIGQGGRTFINALEDIFHQLDYRLWKIENELKNKIKELEGKITQIVRITSVMSEQILKVGEEKRRTCIYNDKGFCTAYEYNKPPDAEIKYIEMGGKYYYEANEFRCYFCIKYQSEEEKSKEQFK